MIILGIETTCDETAAAVVTNNDKRITILSNVVASSASLQAKYGGVIPEQAAREQLNSMIPVLETAVNDSGLNIKDLNAIAVSCGPGLIGSLLIGVETAKTLFLTWKKPLIPINHLIGHFYANWINSKYKVESIMYKGKKQKENPIILDTLCTIPVFPCLGLLVSGGHTDLVIFKDHGKYRYLGGTRDDAAGECFDKCARLLNLPYPGGPAIAKIAQKGNPQAFDLPRPMIDSSDFDFSFSGLKTAVSRIVQNKQFKAKNKKEVANLAASIQQAIIDVLVKKTIIAAQKYEVDQIMIAGGVAANQELIRKLKVKSEKLKVKLHVPVPELCTDNAAMVAAAALYNFNPIDPLKLQADPSLSL